jgi:hypothetical protein
MWWDCDYIRDVEKKKGVLEINYNQVRSVSDLGNMYKSSGIA